MAADGRGPTLQVLVGDALRDGLDLVRKEFALFRAEMTSNVVGLGKAALMFVAAAVFAIAALIWLTQALFYGIDVFVHSPWISALIVGAILALVAGTLALIGNRWLSAANLAPDRTVNSIRRDGEVFTERSTA